MSEEKLLSAGAITQILENQKPANPVLQIIGYKPMTPDQVAFGTVSDELRYRLMIGDGIKAHQYCVITNQDIVEDIRSGRLDKWAIIKVTSYQTVECGGTDGAPDTKRCLIYILNLEVIKRGAEVGRKLSVDPSSLGRVTAPTSNEPPRQQPATPVRPAPTGYPGDNQTQPQPYPLSNMGNQNSDLIRSPKVVRGNYDSQTIGIGELTPYIGKWVVKGRISHKGNVREYSNAKGAGKLFNFTIADKTGEVKVTAFNADCERFYAYVEPGKVYVLGKAMVKAADKRYTSADFEITLNSDSLLEEVMDSRAGDDIPQARYNFVTLGSLANQLPTQPVDLIGAITQVSETATIMSRTKNKELKKRNITIVDMTRHSLGVTLWGEQTDSFTGCVGDVFVTKSARISSYGGKSASAGDCIFVNPDIPEVRKMKNWYSNLLDSNFTALTQTMDSSTNSDQWKTLKEMLDLNVAKMNVNQVSSQYGRCKATLLSVGKNPVYKCCPVDGCGKKLVDTQNGELKCDKCQQTYTNYKFRYMTSVEIGDQTSSTWVTLWDEKAEAVLQMKPEELERYMRMENKEAYERIMTRPNFKPFIFNLRSRIDTYNQEERVKLQVTSMVPMDPVTYSRRLIDEIKQLSAH